MFSGKFGKLLKYGPDRKSSFTQALYFSMYLLFYFDAGRRPSHAHGNQIAPRFFQARSIFPI